MQKISAKLEGVQKLADNIYHYDFSFYDEKVAFKAGQFFLLDIAPKVSRAYSVASEPGDIGFSMCIKLLENGLGSTYLKSLKVGDSVDFSGPFGHFTLKESTKDIVMVATGTGIAPFMSMLPVLFGNGFNKPVTLFFGNTNEKGILYKNKLLEFEKTHENFSVVFLCSKPSPTWKGEVGRVQQFIREGAFDPENTKFYICGNGDMVMDVREMLLNELNVPKEDVHFEQFSPPKSGAARRN